MSCRGRERYRAAANRLDLEQDATRTWEAVRGSPGGAASDLAQAGPADRGRRQGRGSDAHGPAGDPVNGHIATVLAEKDPEALKAAMRELQKERVRKALVDRNAARAQQQTGRFLGGVFGASVIDPADSETAY